MPGTTLPTSQLDWLSSTTAMIVLSWSRGTRDLLKSFGWGIAALHRLCKRRNCHPRRPPHSISPLEEDEFELSVPDFERTFFIRPGAWTCQLPRESEPDFDDRQRQGYRPPSQAGPGNDIHAGSPGLQKAPTRGPASLARFFLESSHKLRSIKPAP